MELPAQLVPAPGTAARGRYEQVTCCLLSEMDAQALWIHRKHEAPEVTHLLGGPVPAAVAHAREWFDKVMDVLAAELAASGGPYLLGDMFSPADILLVHCLQWAQGIGWWPGDDEAVPPKMRGVAAYLARCKERPAYQRTLARAREETEPPKL